MLPSLHVEFVYRHIYRSKTGPLYEQALAVLWTVYSTGRCDSLSKLRMLFTCNVRKIQPTHVAPPVQGERQHAFGMNETVYVRMRGDSAEAILRRYTAPEEVLEMPGHCGACGAPCMTRMYQTEIPFFKACPSLTFPPQMAPEHKCLRSFVVHASWHIVGLLRCHSLVNILHVRLAEVQVWK